MYYESQYYGVQSIGDHVSHHGIKGQKWGIRRFQNPDGTLTDQGKKRYMTRDAKRMARDEKKLEKYRAKELKILDKDTKRETLILNNTSEGLKGLYENELKKKNPSERRLKEYEDAHAETFAKSKLRLHLTKAETDAIMNATLEDVKRERKAVRDTQALNTARYTLASMGNLPVGVALGRLLTDKKAIKRGQRLAPQDVARITRDVNKEIRKSSSSNSEFAELRKKYGYDRSSRRR